MEIARIKKELDVEPMAVKRQRPRTRKQEQTPVYITHLHLPVSERILLYKDALSPQQLANEVGVNRETIYLWAAAGTLPVRRAGNRLKFDQGPTATWAKSREYLPVEQW
jgi:hypothetical protein